MTHTFGHETYTDYNRNGPIDLYTIAYDLYKDAGDMALDADIKGYSYTYQVCMDIREEHRRDMGVLESLITDLRQEQGREKTI